MDAIAKGDSTATESSGRKSRGKSGTVDSNATIDRILDAAEEVFAEKGISGARVEQIALRAGVAKALIYYYFKGKQELFQAVIGRTIKANISVKLSALEAPREGHDVFDALMHAGNTYMRSKLNVLRIMMLELLKKDDTGNEMLRLIDEMFVSTKRAYRDTPLLSNLAEGDMPPELFFFGSMPFSLFLLLEDKWIEHYQVSREALEARFFEVEKKIMRILLGIDSKEKL